jgi:hypothetical protein
MVNVRSLALAALAAVGMGCSGGSSSPLVGNWAEVSTTLGVTTTTTYEVNGDGTLTVTAAGSGNCSGTETVTGLQWAATSTSITFSGAGTCSGSVTCGPITINCAGSQTSYSGSCTYALSNGNDTLALTGCTGTTDKTLLRSN